MRVRRCSMLLLLGFWSAAAACAAAGAAAFREGAAGSSDGLRPCRIELAGAGELRTAHGVEQLDLPAYWTTDSVWAGAHPLLVGRDFDFTIALADGIGAGVAASLRRQGNLAVAEELVAKDDLQLESSFREALARDGAACALLEGAGPSRLYGLLFGDQDARLQVVLHAPPRAGDPRPRRLSRFVALSEARPLRGEASWLDDGGARLRQAARAGAVAVARLVSLGAMAAAPDATPAGQGEPARCPIGGAEAWTGTPIALRTDSGKGTAGPALVTSGPEPALVSCAASAAN